MSTFLDLYVTLVGFINYKLYSDENLIYPPKLDSKMDENGGDLNAFILQPIESSVISNLVDDGDKMSRREMKKISSTAILNKSNVSTDNEQVIELGIESLETQDDDTLVQIKSQSESHLKFRNLFKDCVFFLAREAPKSLLFVIKAFNGTVGFESEDSAIKINDAKITHHIVDRPVESRIENRDYVQPQWIFDCVNAKRLLKTVGYHPGDTLPPHLSPFVKYEEGDYVPEEAKKMFGVSAVSVAKGLDMVGESETLEQESQDEQDNLSSSDDEDQNDNEDDEDEKMYQEELKAEAMGLTYTEYKKQQDEQEPESKKQKVSKSSKKSKLAAEKEQAELDQRKIMMGKKDRRLYAQIEYSKGKKAAVASVLADKKAKLVKGKSAGWKKTEKQ